MNKKTDSGTTGRTDETRGTGTAPQAGKSGRRPAKKPAARAAASASSLAENTDETAVRRAAGPDNPASPADSRQADPETPAATPLENAVKPAAKPRGVRTAAKASIKATAKAESTGSDTATSPAGAVGTGTTEKTGKSRARTAGPRARALSTKSPAPTPPRSIAEADAMLVAERAARKTREAGLRIQPEPVEADNMATPTRPPKATTPRRGKTTSKRAEKPARTTPTGQAPPAAPTPEQPLEQAGRPVPQPSDSTETPVQTVAAASAPVMPERSVDLEPNEARQDQETALGEGQEQKRRRRSRRGGRRRSKSQAAQAATGEHAAPEQEPAAESPAATRPAMEDAVPDGGIRVAEPAQAVSSATHDKPGDKPASGRNAAPRGKDSKAGRRMFISILSGELVELVLTDNGTVQEYYVEMSHQAKMKGNIYKGVVSNVDANLQAAFIAYGGAKNGFLQIDEIHPEYYQVAHDPKGHKFPPIQKALKPGQEILVQVVKEPSGAKGAFLTSYLSLPGRFLVLTPGREQIGVSRKVDDDEERGRLRDLLNGLNPGKGLGVIVRTVSMGAGKTSLQRDLQFLKRLWKDVRAKGTTIPAPGLVYQELDLATRAIRDYLTDEVQEVWVDDAGTAGTMQEMATLLFPKKKDLVHIHSDPDQTLFERFGLQKQLDQIYSRETVLPSGGRLVFDHTEALTAIDINSSRSGGKAGFEDMAYRINLEAARMIPLQLRLRDIGGQVVADFIEMRDRDHWREVEKAVRAGMKGDRARYDVGKIGPFGLLEIVRQRLGSSAISVSTEPCPVCKGTGFRRNMEWQSLRALRGIHKLMRQAQAQGKTAATFQGEPELALYLLNTKRGTLQALEKQYGVQLTIALGTESGAC